MTQKEKLIEILSKRICRSADILNGSVDGVSYKEILADFLIENGVVILPCQISAKVYDIRRFYKRGRVVSQTIVCGEIDHFTIGEAGKVITAVCFQGNEWADYAPDELILTREEAESALKA